MSFSPLECTIDFGQHGNGTSFTVSGWSTPEPTETWSIGARSRLRIPAPTVPATYIMLLTLRPHVKGTLTAQRLRVLVGDIEIGRFVIQRRTMRACRIPWSSIGSRKDIDIVLETPDAARPADLGGSTDRRQLSVAVTSVALFPDAGQFGEAGADLLSDEPIVVDIDAVSAVESLTQGQLLLRFESLGQNCEFGLVQRACGAEPLGLLRFSSTPLPALLTALEARFEGMGAADKLTVSISSNGRELMVADSCYGFLYHAWVAAGEMSVDEVRQRESRRVPFLVRKLLEDLETSEKTFVFKSMGRLAEEEVFALAMLLRRYGPNTLLFVTLADAEHRAGTVEARAAGFLVGYIDRFAPSDDAQDFQLDQWIRLCRETYRYRLAAAAVSRRSAIRE